MNKLSFGYGNVKVGDYITFGRYKQGNNTSSGKEDIEWLVLDVQGSKALIISKYALDAEPYNSVTSDVTWKTCTLRQWLNYDFLDTAFSDTEKSKIAITKITTTDNPFNDTKASNITLDKIFLLSTNEVNRYFTSDEDKICKPTAYAEANGAYRSSYYDSCWWWLRSPGSDQDDAAYVRSYGVASVGFANEDDNCVDGTNFAVRPALWINLDNDRSGAADDVGDDAEETTDDSACGSYHANDTDLGTSKNEYKNVNVGDYITFGLYKQNNNTSSGKEDIEWLVLDVQNGKALVISKYGLDAKPYNTEGTNVTWETCTLRQWLNNDFLNTAFTNTEKAKIVTTKVTADKNPKYNTDPGNDTQDKVFLLSIDEVNKYFSSDSARQCKPTAYAIENGAYASSNYDNCCWWWLRSPGCNLNNAAYVIYVGDVGERGRSVNLTGSAVRPALWIKLNA